MAEAGPKRKPWLAIIPGLKTFHSCKLPKECRYVSGAAIGMGKLVPARVFKFDHTFQTMRRVLCWQLRVPARSKLSAFGPVGERQVLAGGEPKSKVSFQAGREAKVSSTRGGKLPLSCEPKIASHGLRDCVLGDIENAISLSLTGEASLDVYGGEYSQPADGAYHGLPGLAALVRPNPGYVEQSQSHTYEAHL